MAEYKKFARPSSMRPNGPRPQRAYGAKSSQDRELFTAECNSCHEQCQVPFRPNGKKPVYCAKCFTREDSRGVSTYSNRTDFKPRSSYNASAPSAGVPDRQIQDLKKQIETMNVTLEKLVTAVDTFNRATALTQEIRKHFPAEEKKPAKKAPKKVAKKTAKK